MGKPSNGERLMALEVKVDSIKEDVVEIKETLSCHVKSSDSKYAPKERLETLEDRFEVHVQKQGDDDSWWKKNAFNITMVALMALITLLTYLK